MKSKRIVSLLCAVLLMLSLVPAQAADTVVALGDFDYRITEGGAQVVQFYKSGASQVEIPASVQGYPVVEIGEEVFRNVEGITQITLPHTLLRIGDRAFYACSDLESLTLPASLTDIGEMAFSNCYALEQMLIPAGVQRIGRMAFANCTSLQSLQVEAGSAYFAAVDNVLFSADMTTLLAYPNALSATEYRVPDSVSVIDEKAFQECGNLEAVLLPSELTEIEKYAFSGCIALRSVQIPDRVDVIGAFAFSNCSGLTAVHLGQGVTAVAAYTFQNCESLTSVTLSDSLRSIASRAFAECGDIEQLTIPDTVEQIAPDAFGQTAVGRVRFYSTAQREAYAHLFPQSEIVCLCLNAHTYAPDDPANCAVCDYSLDASAPPVLASVTHDTVVLAVHESYEYSYDLIHWRRDGIFADLAPHTDYAFYARIRGVSDVVSRPLLVTTDRAPQPKADPPIVQEVTPDSITLSAVVGCEYSLDGLIWQTDPCFTGLTANADYRVYQRYAATETHYVGPISDPTDVRTGGGTGVTSSVYTVTDDCIRAIPAGTDVQTLLDGLQGVQEATVYKGGTAVSGQTKAGTGMTVTLVSGKSYTLIVTGDTNGDGEITITDMIAVKAHILEKTRLTGAQAQAADTSGDNNITITDFIQIKAKLLGKGTITAR